VAGVSVVASRVSPVPARRLMLVRDRRWRTGRLLEMLGPLARVLLVVLVTIHGSGYPLTMIGAFMPPA
jgi:hypothetical protein